jgi:2-dehydropantoate 2-reductase
MNTEINTVVAVLGPGAIGTTVAAALHEVGRTPLLCGRTPRDSLTLQDGNRFITVPGPVQTNPAQITRTVDLIFLAVKSTQIDAAAEWLRALTGPETVICVLQNGVEQLDRLATYSLPGQIVPAVVWFPAQAQSDGSVRLRGEARLSVPDAPASRVVAAALQGTWCSVDLAANFSSWPGAS